MEVTPSVESNHSSPLVLHIEDDDGDAHLVVRCLGHWPKPVRILRAADGKEALEILESIDSGDHEHPHLVFLDLKLPYYTGIELLRWKSERTNLGKLPFIVLTSSDSQSDTDQCHEAGCTEYFVKPMDYIGLKKTLDEIRTRHFTVNPPGGGEVGWAA